MFLRNIFQICVVNEEYLFLGSRLGNSLLLRYSEKDHSTIITIDDSEAPEKGKNYQYLILIFFFLQKKNILEVTKRRLEDEELEVYGSGQKTSVQLTSFTFEVCDSILNIGPIGFMSVGNRFIEGETDELDENEVENQSDMDLEIVTSSGHGKNGTLCVLQNSIKPQIITSFDLSGMF